MHACTGWWGAASGDYRQSKDLELCVTCIPSTALMNGAGGLHARRLIENPAYPPMAVYPEAGF